MTCEGPAGVRVGVRGRGGRRRGRRAAEGRPARRRLQGGRAGSRAGRPITGSGRGATRSSSASAGAPTRTGAGTTTSTTTGPEEFLLARSRDGGATWSVERPGPPGALAGTPGMRHGRMPADAPAEHPGPLDEPIDFTRPDFAMTVRMENSNNGASRYYYSYDRGHTWRGPFALPLFGQPGVMGRTDYLVNGPARLPAVPHRLEGQRPRRPAVLRADDRRRAGPGASSSFIGPEPVGLCDHALDGPRSGRPTW